MIYKMTRQMISGALLFMAANLGYGQHFEELTKDLEINFPETKGVIEFRPISGVPFPKPKTMKMQPGEILLSKEGKIACSIVISPEASLTEKSAATELSNQIEFMTGTEQGPKIIKDGSDIPTPTVCVLGVGEKIFKTVKMNIPKQPEGFVIKTGKWKNANAVFIGGRDRFGVYWGIQTLKQLLYKGKMGQVSAPKGNVTDWPDAQYRLAICMQYMLGNSAKRLAYLVRNGRANMTPIQLLNTKKIFDKNTIKQTVEALHKRGIISIAYIYWIGINRFLKNTEDRTICPMSDMDLIKSLTRTAFESGVDGISINFDDVHPKDLMHYKSCPLCSKKFKTPAEAQVYTIQNIIDFARKNGWDKKLFLVCPTLYFDAKEPYKPYTNIGLLAENYYPKLCGFPEAKNVRFYHCDFTSDSLKILKQSGLKNYAWWNNGGWSGVHGEVWGYPTGLARLGYSWGMYDKGLPKTGEEIFFPEKISELRNLRGKTDFVFSGTNNLLGQAIGCLFAWDMEHYMTREPEFQEWYINNYCQKNVIADFRAWEWAVKPLLSKCIKEQPFTKRDFRLLEAAYIALERIQHIKNPRQPFISAKRMKELLDMLEKYKNFYSKLKKQAKIKKRISFNREKGCLLSVSYKNLLKRPESSNNKSTILEKWKKTEGLNLIDCSLIPAANSEPAKVTSTNPLRCILKKEHLNIDVTDFKYLRIPCNLSRGTQLVIKASIDGKEHAGTPISGHSPEWQEFILPISGKKLTSFQLCLNKDLSISNPSEYCNASLRPIHLESNKANIDTLMISDDPIELAEFDNKKGFLLTNNKLTIADDRFTLNRHSFSVEVHLTPIQIMCSKVIGTRAAYSFLGRGIPGWILGVGNGRCGFVFTIEDKDKVLSYVQGGGKPERFNPTHVIAVRDFPNRKLYLYVNGKKVAETNEKGSGIFGDQQRTLGLSFDSWTGKRMNGFLQSLKLYDRALSEEEIKKHFNNSIIYKQ